MLKRGILIFAVLFLVIFSNLAFIIAEEDSGTVDTSRDTGITEESSDSGTSDNDVVEGISEQESSGISEEEIQREFDAGTTPDSAFYFIDSFFDRFGDELEVKEEKVAEIKEMINAGNIEGAREALEGYKKYAESVEREIAPEEKERAKRSSELIKAAVEGFEDELSSEDREDFVDDIIEKENKIQTAVNVASKIKELCIELAKLDPSEYSRVCRVEGEDAPKWQKRLDKDLTQEQRNAAEKFARVMEQCFRTQGRNCACDELEDINKPFADRCGVIAPLAAKCEEGDEGACEAMDDATSGIEDSLPDYLRDIFEELEGDVNDARFDLYMPGECKERGAKSPKECARIMIENNAPEECKEELIRKEVQNEKEARKICEEIMFKQNAPEECVEAGVRDPKECGKVMFQANAPEECIEAGLTGENRNDPKKCEEIMNEFGGNRGGPRGDRAASCKGIQDAEERLKCYDESLAGIAGGEHESRGGGWPEPCQKAQALTRESCERVMQEWGKSQRRDFEGREEFERHEDEFREGEREFRDEGREGEFREGEDFERQDREFRQPQCAPGQSWTCFDGSCGCIGEAQQENRDESTTFPSEDREQEDRTEEHTETEIIESGESNSGEGSSSSESSSSSEESSSSGESSSSSSSSSGGESSAGVTGGVISLDNKFLDFYWN